MHLLSGVLDALEEEFRDDLESAFNVRLLLFGTVEPNVESAMFHSLCKLVSKRGGKVRKSGSILKDAEQAGLWQGYSMFSSAGEEALVLV